MNKNIRKMTRSEIIKKNRKRQVRNQYISLVAVSLFIVIICFSFFGSKSVACEEDNNELYKYYKTVQITSEQSLYDFADIYAVDEFGDAETYVLEVMFMNNMESDKLTTPGKYIIIPYYDTFHS